MSGSVIWLLLSYNFHHPRTLSCRQLNGNAVLEAGWGSEGDGAHFSTFQVEQNHCVMVMRVHHKGRAWRQATKGTTGLWRWCPQHPQELHWVPRVSPFPGPERGKVTRGERWDWRRERVILGQGRKKGLESRDDPGKEQLRLEVGLRSLEVVDQREPGLDIWEVALRSWGKARKKASVSKRKLSWTR
jgi:hypothetical protein